MPGVSITSPLPEVGVTAGPAWASQLLTWCQEVEADMEAAIVPGEITVNADFEFSGYKATELRGSKYESQSTVSTGVGNQNMVEVVLGELYFVDGNGSSVKLTSNGALNLATTGGITGNYTATSAEVSYSSADTRYTFLDHNATARPAGLDCGDILLREKAASANAITVKSPASLGANYTLQLPPSGATGTKILTGVAVGSTISLAFSEDLNLATVVTTGVGTFGSGAKFKSGGTGSTTLDYFHQAGVTSTTLGWTPVIVLIGGSGTVSYTKRYAWIQVVGDWAHVFATIRWTTNTTEACSLKVTGLPFKAMGDSYTSAPASTTGYFTAIGQVAEWPQATGTAGQVRNSADSGTAVVSQTIFCAMFDEDDEIFFFDTTTNYDNTDNNYPSYLSAGVPGTGTLAPNRDAATTLTLGRTYTITLQMSYRISA